MQYNKIKELKEDEINKKISDNDSELIKIMYLKAKNELKDTSQINKIKKESARLKTYLSMLSKENNGG
ncbi:50S ribosomal protein L29 [Candidatus Marinamargulisbacteria bacterium SCGC AG-410-N11]|nr:50S ribosomal protein L29 [Candidatus Marinamargulisbacteria bacterium SCGC AG-410-N11]